MAPWVIEPFDTHSLERGGNGGGVVMRHHDIGRDIDDFGNGHGGLACSASQYLLGKALPHGDLSGLTSGRKRWSEGDAEGVGYLLGCGILQWCAAKRRMWQRSTRIVSSSNGKTRTAAKHGFAVEGSRQYR